MCEYILAPEPGPPITVPCCTRKVPECIQTIYYNILYYIILYYIILYYVILCYVILYYIILYYIILYYIILYYIILYIYILYLNYIYIYIILILHIIYIVSYIHSTSCTHGDNKSAIYNYSRSISLSEQKSHVGN